VTFARLEYTIATIRAAITATVPATVATTIVSYINRLYVSHRRALCWSGRTAGVSFVRCTPLC